MGSPSRASAWAVMRGLGLRLGPSVFSLGRGDPGRTRLSCECAVGRARRWAWFKPTRGGWGKPRSPRLLHTQLTLTGTFGDVRCRRAGAGQAVQGHPGTTWEVRRGCVRLSPVLSLSGWLLGTGTHTRQPPRVPGRGRSPRLSAGPPGGWRHLRASLPVITGVLAPGVTQDLESGPHL